MDINPSKSSLVPWAEAHGTSIVSVNRQIEDTIAAGVDIKLWRELEPNLISSGSAGGRIWDHAVVAMKLQTAIPGLKAYRNLTIHTIYDRFVAVAKRRGFVMVGGYISGHVNDDAAEVSDKHEGFEDVEVEDAEVETIS